jgi:hypothetical protein
MFGAKKRPWKKAAHITRIETNGGDVQYRTTSVYVTSPDAPQPEGTFESLVEAEKHLDAWYADWWPKQIKHTRRA